MATAYLRRELMKTDFDTEKPESMGSVTEPFDMPDNAEILNVHWFPGRASVTWLIREE